MYVAEWKMDALKIKFFPRNTRIVKLEEYNKKILKVKSAEDAGVQDMAVVTIPVPEKENLYQADFSIIG